MRNRILASIVSALWVSCAVAVAQQAGETPSAAFLARDVYGRAKTLNMALYEEPFEPGRDWDLGGAGRGGFTFFEGVSDVAGGADGYKDGGNLYRRRRNDKGGFGYERLFFRFYMKFNQDHAPIHHYGSGLVGFHRPTPWPQGGAGERPRGELRCLPDRFVWRPTTGQGGYALHRERGRDVPLDWQRLEGNQLPS